MERTEIEYKEMELVKKTFYYCFQAVLHGKEITFIYNMLDLLYTSI